MSCYRPIRAFQCIDGSVVFSELRRSDTVRSLDLPCGQCVGCRLERSRQWAMRCLHESKMHSSNCFITLTYDDSHLPEDGSLNYRHFQLFMKRLRKFSGVRVRFYMCGEYGELLNRPHFHACLFGFDFVDKLYWKVTTGKSKLYRSRSLEALWPYGFSSIGEVNFESAAYVARYIMKKVTGDPALLHYTDVETGVIRCPEFNHMSLKPGIGAAWLAKYRSDVYPEGMCVVNAKKVRPPKYYDRVFKREEDGSDLHQRLLDEREAYARERVADSTPERLAVREQVVRARVKQLTRKL